MTVLTFFATTALCLACLGLYGTLSYAVSLRRREVALRLALGAQRNGVIRQLAGRALRTIGLACVCGLALSAVFTRLLSGMLYGVSATHPITLASVLGLVIGLGSIAAFIPAARAASVEPMRVLRDD